MLKSRCALLFLLFPCAAAAQYPGDEYYPYAEREERRELLTTDSTIFYRAVQSPSDLYGLRTGFNLPQVALRRRGLDYTLERTSLMGVAVSYRYLAALRLLGAEEQRYAGLAAAPGEPAAAGGMRAFRFSDGEPLQPFLASVRFTDRNYLVGAKAAVSASPGDGWRISAALDARSGRDMHVEGVFTNAVTAGLRLARRFGEGHELSVLCIVPPSVRGTRHSSSEEAFTLTGDRLYNPAWGWQDGRVRNSRVRRETVPLALAAYAGSAIAKAPPMRTAFNATRLAIAAFIVPYIFAFNNTMLFIGDFSPLDVVQVVLTSSVGMFLIAAGMIGYMLRDLNWGVRIVCIAAGLMLIHPGTLTDIIGIGVLVVVLVCQIITGKGSKAVKAA